MIVTFERPDLSRCSNVRESTNVNSVHQEKIRVRG
jgi:hypothetical protein